MQLCNENSKKDDVPKLARDIFEWIRINASAKLSVTDVANFFNFTPEYMTRLTKKYFDTSLKSLICNFIVSQAKNLLLNSNYSIKEIAEIEYKKGSLKTLNIDTIKSRLRLARQYLRNNITRDGQRIPHQTDSEDVP